MLYLCGPIPECEDKVRAAFPDGGWPDFIRIAARYHAHLTATYHTGQIAHPLAEPLCGEWYVLLHLGMLYIDVQPYLVPTCLRRVAANSA